MFDFITLTQKNGCIALVRREAIMSVHQPTLTEDARVVTLVSPMSAQHVTLYVSDTVEEIQAKLRVTE